jgi:hypothetical protein
MSKLNKKDIVLVLALGLWCADHYNMRSKLNESVQLIKDVTAQLDLSTSVLNSCLNESDQFKVDYRNKSDALYELQNHADLCDHNNSTLQKNNDTLKGKLLACSIGYHALKDLLVSKLKK